MYSWGWRPYVSVAEKKWKAAKTVAKMVKKRKKISPVQIEGRLIAKTFWGKAWCHHLESFSDFENRLPRGRSYVRNGSVIHLDIAAGKIKALVQGSSLYKAQIDISAVDQKKWRSISRRCSGEIGSVIELLQGKLSSSVMTTITDKQNGLFPLPKEIKLNCSCPDWADMCKHVAAALYGAGARLDNEPELLFTLRKVDHLALISKAAVRAPTKRSGKANVIQDQDLSDLFGIDIEDRTHSSVIAKKTTDAPLSEKVTKKKALAKKRRSKKRGNRRR